MDNSVYEGKEHLPEMVARQIEAMILDGRLKEGDQLPSERLLCQKLRVSRNSLREALKDLRARGIIKTRTGSGSRVAFFQDLVPSSSLLKLLRSHPESIDSLLEVRRLLEGEASYLAAERASPEDMMDITRAFDALERGFEDELSIQALAQKDIQFHQSIYKAAHNPVLLLALNGIRGLMMSFTFDVANRLYPIAVNKHNLLTQHRRIYRAIERGDSAAARRAAFAHIDAVSDELHALK